jgi:hypothetical protein
MLCIARRTEPSVPVSGPYVATSHGEIHRDLRPCVAWRSIASHRVA